LRCDQRPHMVGERITHSSTGNHQFESPVKAALFDNETAPSFSRRNPYKP